MSNTTFELAFGESAVVSFSVIGVTAASFRLKRPSVSLLHGSAQCCGVPLALYSPVPLELNGNNATVIDCASELGCRLQISSAPSRPVSIRRVPFASNSLQRFLNRVQDARCTAKTAGRPPPRVLTLGFGDGASSWCARTTTIATAVTSPQQQQQPPPPVIVIDLSLLPHEVKLLDDETNSNNATSKSRTIPAGCVSLQFVSGASNFDPVCTELYTFFVGSCCGAEAADDTLLDILSSINDIIMRISSSTIEFAAATLLLNLGEGEFGHEATRSNAASADGAQPDASPLSAAQRLGSFLPRILRMLRISHVGALVGTAAPEAGQIIKSLRTAVSSVVYGVVLEEILLTWPPLVASVQQQQSSSRLIRSESVQRYLLSNGSGSEERAPIFRIVLDVTKMKLLDAKTLKPMSLGQVKQFAVCGVVAASALVAERIAEASAPPVKANTDDAAAAGANGEAEISSSVSVHSALRRPVVGFLVVSDIGASSSLVVVSPAAGDLPSNTLLVSNDLAVEFAPSVLATN